MSTARTVVDEEGLAVDKKKIADTARSSRTSSSKENVPHDKKATVERREEGVRKRRHSPGNEKRCHKCGKIVADKYMLASHIRRNHLKGSRSVKLTACPKSKCSYKHASEVKVFKHINKVHYQRSEANKKGDVANSRVASSSRIALQPNTPTPAAGTQAPAAGTQAPAAGTQAPAAGTPAPAAGTPAQAAGTQAPAAGTQVQSTTPASNMSPATHSDSESGMTPDTAMLKCKNFLATLLRLIGEEPASVALNVRALIQDVIDDAMEIEEFATKLQRELNSSPQPCLVPFLKKSLPHLQCAMRSGELKIDGLSGPNSTINETDAEFSHRMGQLLQLREQEIERLRQCEIRKREQAALELYRMRREEGWRRHEETWRRHNSSLPAEPTPGTSDGLIQENQQTLVIWRPEEISFGQKEIHSGFPATQAAAPIPSFSTPPVTPPASAAPPVDADVEVPGYSPSNPPLALPTSSVHSVSTVTPKTGTSEEPTQKQLEEGIQKVNSDIETPGPSASNKPVAVPASSRIPAPVLICQIGLEEVMRLACDRRVPWAVRTLVRGFIDGDVEHAAFEAKLQQIIGSLGPDDPCMDPQFLKRSLPLLRSALRFGTVTIDDKLHKESGYNLDAVEKESDYRSATDTQVKKGEERIRRHSESGSQTSRRMGCENNTERDSDSTKTSQRAQQSISSTNDSPKRRKITRMVREREGPPDPYQVLIDNLCDHLAIPQNRDFNVDVSLGEKEEAGHRLKELLEVLSDGALVPLMHVTLNNTNVKKLAELKGVIIPLLAEKLSLTDDRSFHDLNQNEQTNAGNQLRDLVRGVAGDAIVPLMNATLSRDEVKKLCCLKGIQGSDLETEDADEDTDVDENMALADRDIQAQNAVQGNINLETEQTNENHLPECNDPPIASIKGGDTNPKTNQNSDEGRQTEGSSSRTDGDGSTINRAQREPALRRDLMKLGVNLQKQIMDFICDKCD